MTSDEARNDRAVEKHDEQRCDICDEPFPSDEIHDGVCDRCSDAMWDLDASEEVGL